MHLVVEDRRTERFLRHLFVHRGFQKRNLRFDIAPQGVGSGEAWVRARYPSAVRVLRSKPHQALALVAVRDGDNVGVRKRKEELDTALIAAGLEPRSDEEAIATPVPSWSIESWLLDLLGRPGVNEAQVDPADDLPWKIRFERDHGEEERDALRAAAEAFSTGGSPLPSLTDGRTELARI